MIRILQVLGGLNRGGAETMVMNLYRAIDHKKVQFDFIIHSATQNDYENEIKEFGGKIYVFPPFKGYNIIKYKKVWKNFLREHPEYRIVHSHVRSYASIFFPIAKKYGLKTIIHSHSTSNGYGIKGKIKDILQKPLIYQSDYLFSCSDLAGKWLFGEKGIRKDNYYIIKNAIDVNKYRYNKMVREEYKKKLEVENNIVFGHVGRLTIPKNHIYLLKVFKKIVEKKSNAVLLIIGDGELKEQIQNQIIEYGLQNNVKLLGSRDDIPEIMQVIDVFLFPSLWEGFPMTIIEAQAAGLPCIISNNITSEVKLATNVEMLSVDETEIDNWVKHSLKSINNRLPDASKLILSAGFDINITSKWLIQFYRRILNE